VLGEVFQSHSDSDSAQVVRRKSSSNQTAERAVTYGVDAVRQVLLATHVAGAGLGVTVLGHSMTVVQEVALVGLIGVALVASASWAFGREA
jgi:hypothetical protein